MENNLLYEVMKLNKTICGISSEGRIRTFQFEVWVRSLHSAQNNNYYFMKMIFINNDVFFENMGV